MTHSSLIKELAMDLNKLSKTLMKIDEESKMEQATDVEQEKTIVNSVKDSLQEISTKKTVSIEEVRSVLAEKSQEGLTSKVKELLESFGANKLSAVKSDDYETLLTRAKEL